MNTKYTCTVLHKDFEPRRQLEPKGLRRTLPELPDCRATLTKEERPLIAERQLPVYRKVNITNEKRDAQFRERAELSWIFESLRAAVHVPFDFPNLVRVLWGFSNLQHAASRLPDFPDFRVPRSGY